MKSSLSTIALAALSAALICGGATFGWHFVRAGIAQRKLVEEAQAYRTRAEAGNANAQYELARLYYEGKGVAQDYQQAAEWYRRAADQGNAKAEYGIGFMYHGGKGVPQDDAAALSWCRKAADQGNMKAQYVVGEIYYDGKGVPQDYSEAARWYRKAGDQGYARAQCELGYMFFQGKGVPQDDTEAVAWFRKAADQGFTSAQDYLAYMYFYGKGVPRDYVESARWYRKAAKQGDDYARNALSAMRISFSTFKKIELPVVCLFSIALIIPSKGDIRNRQHRRAAVAGLLGLFWVGATVFWHIYFGLLLSLSAVNGFYFGKGLLSGASVVMLLSIASPGLTKIVLQICGVLFVGFNVSAIVHFHLRSLTACPRAFYSMNGLLIGTAITAIILLLNSTETTGSQNESGGVAPQTAS